ncbi:hypothetical protein [Allorhodopirellula solitaria]|uniref:Uncharacterized protein n=1 Tax=Allorhodopirellula solitaria TaxID=2527987 RepID=A0A5C5XRX9_9BACT|nr:hypothetical protein [Allorhodopirellula solitaria]TWT65281.1 hypothetical protein CA85_31930 [Allorhodopirellula solitaria]
MFTSLPSSLFPIGISNAFIATGLAGLVFLLSWKSKWPAWSHLLREYTSAMLKPVDFLSGNAANRNKPRLALLLPLAILTLTPSPVIGQTSVEETNDTNRQASQAPTSDKPDPVTDREAGPASGDPFAQPDSSSRQTDDPFAAGSDNPFDGGSAFAGKPDPFAGGGRSGDPFADHSPQANRTSKRRQSGAAAKKSLDASAKDPATGRGAAQRRQTVEESLRAALRRSISLRVPDVPLKEALHILSEMADIPILIDTRALREIEISTDSPITVRASNISTHSMLRLILRNLDLTYVIENEVILITTPSVAEQTLALKTYVLPHELVTRSDKILSALITNVKPDVWSEAGGTSTSSAIDNVLVISTTEDVHDDVESFLLKVETAFAASQPKHGSSQSQR